MNHCCAYTLKTDISTNAFHHKEMKTGLILTHRATAGILNKRPTGSTRRPSPDDARPIRLTARHSSATYDTATSALFTSINYAFILNV